MKERLIQRGQIYYAHLGKALGSEQGGSRPVLVIQNNKGNWRSPTIIVAPITSQKKIALPTHVLLKKIPRLQENSCVLLEQVRCIDRGRLGTYLNKVPPIQMQKVDKALQISVGLDNTFN